MWAPHVLTKDSLLSAEGWDKTGVRPRGPQLTDWELLGATVFCREGRSRGGAVREAAFYPLQLPKGVFVYDLGSWSSLWLVLTLLFPAFVGERGSR